MDQIQLYPTVVTSRRLRERRLECIQSRTVLATMAVHSFGPESGPNSPSFYKVLSRSLDFSVSHVFLRNDRSLTYDSGCEL